MSALDEARERYYLLGDEDCGVGIYCRDCNHGGRPLAYYEGVSGPWLDKTVPTVRRVILLLAAMGEHEASGLHAVENATVTMPTLGGIVPAGEPSSDVPDFLSWCPNGGTQPMPAISTQREMSQRVAGDPLIT